MRIALAFDALASGAGGIRRYCHELAVGLRNRDDVELLRYFRSGRWRKSYDPALTPATARSPMPRLPKSVRNFVNRHKAESCLVHGPNYFLPDFVSEGIITVHDLSVFRFPDMHPVERVRQFERLFADSLSRAAHVITDTEAVRHEFADFAGVDLSRVTSVPLGVSAEFTPAVRAMGIDALQHWGLQSGQYILALATFEPRKKLEAAITAHRHLPACLRRRFPLVLAGAAGWRNEALAKRIKSAMAEGDVIHLGFVEEALLPVLYAHASLFLFPSVYEGFGLPPLEAMACGLPCIVSREPAVEEVTQGAALVIDPDDEIAFARAIERGLTDETWREAAIEGGLNIAAQFAWTRCVENTCAVYHKVGFTKN